MTDEDDRLAAKELALAIKAAMDDIESKYGHAGGTALAAKIGELIAAAQQRAQERQKK